MRFQVQFHCTDCEAINELGKEKRERETEFDSFTDAVYHVHYNPDHHVIGYIEDDRKLVEIGIEQ